MIAMSVMVTGNSKSNKGGTVSMQPSLLTEHSCNSSYLQNAIKAYILEPQSALLKNVHL